MIAAPWSRLLGGPVTLFFLAFVLVSFAALAIRSVTEGGWTTGLSDDAVWRALRLSLVTSGISMALTVLLGTPMAYWLARSRFPGRGAIDLLIQAPLVLPPVVAGLAMLMAFGAQSPLGEALEVVGIRLPFTTVAVVMAQLFVGAPFFLRTAILGFQAVDPAYEDLAQTLGRSPFGAFWSVSLPLALPSLLGGLAFAWARALGEFGATVMFAGNFPGRTQTMPLAILSALERDLSAALALAVVLTVLSVALLGLLAWWASRRLVWR